MLFGGADPAVYDDNLRIIDTDYENWNVIWGCWPLIKGVFGIDMVWIMSKDPFPAPEHIEAAKAAIQKALPNYPVWMMMRTIQFLCWQRS